MPELKEALNKQGEVKWMPANRPLPAGYEWKPREPRKEPKPEPVKKAKKDK